MLPEVKTFCEAINAANDAHSDAIDKIISERYSESYYEKRNAAVRQRPEAHNAAWTALAASEDKLVAFIATNCCSNSYEAMKVLEILPATRDELDKLADEYDWCGEWDRLVEMAENAGVMPGLGSRAAGWVELRRHLRYQSGLYRSDIMSVMGMVDTIVENAVAAALAGEKPDGETGSSSNE